MRFSRLSPAHLAALAGLLLGAQSALAQGTITGRITDGGTGEPVQDVRVYVLGTSLATASRTDGRYTLVNVPAGARDVRVTRVGYTEQKKSVTVTTGQSATLDFALTAAAIKLPDVVATATGEQRRVELGNAVSTINVAEVTQTAAISSLTDVLNSRTPGVSVVAGSQTGSGATVRIRGSGSLSLSNDPIYVIDGVRMTSNSGSSSLFTGGAQPSRVGDIDPADIEDIEIVKGPSAATLYGTDAANGVIVITTKRGRAGQTRWTATAESGLLEDRNTYPTNYTIAGHSPGSTTYRQCGLPLISAGTCVLDSVRTLNIFDNANLTPLGKGYRKQFGLQASGGSDQVRFFMSADGEGETGVIKLPQFEETRLDTSGVAIADYTHRPNAMRRLSLRANLNAALTPKLDVGITTNFSNVNQRFATESNATVGLGSQVFGGPGYIDNGTVSGQGTPLNGYRAWTPGYTFQELNQQLVNRFIGGTNVNWRPTSWMQNRANVGIDYGARQDINLLLRNEGPPINANYRKGFKDDNRTSIRNFSVDLGSTNTWQFRPTITSKTTLGAQYVAYEFSQADAFAQDLPVGTQTVSAGATPSAGESTVLQNTLGLFIDEAVSFRDRLFVTAAVRTDQNSAFGTNFQRVFYPKASVSWLISEEPFFPRIRGLNEFRLRAAYGASGTQPGSNDALRSFSPTVANLKGTDTPGVLFNTLGNANLKPERATEFETGFDAKFLGGRMTADVTYYSKLTKDALISAIVPPSLGAATTIRSNLGSVKNDGWEFQLYSQVLERRSLGIDLSLSASANSNKLVSLGGLPPQVGTTTRAQAGYPLFGFWAQPITGWDDKNHDGILTYNADPALNEVFLGDSAVFRGYHTPRYTLTAQAGFDLMNRRLRITALGDYRGGNLWYNNTERIRCVSRQNCNGLMNPDASFEEQAMVVATRDNPARTLDGFFQPGWFYKLREVSATYTLPESIAQRVFRSRTASVNFAGRNLAKYTKYRGVDPETDRDAGASSDTPDEFQTLANPTYFILRFSVGY
jgi:TonB-linked SusC/RagA family outer membrane protein